MTTDTLFKAMVIIGCRIVSRPSNLYFLPPWTEFTKRVCEAAVRLWAAGEPNPIALADGAIREASQADVMRVYEAIRVHAPSAAKTFCRLETDEVCNETLVRVLRWVRDTFTFSEGASEEQRRVELESAISRVVFRTRYRMHLKMSGVPAPRRRAAANPELLDPAPLRRKVVSPEWLDQIPDQLEFFSNYDILDEFEETVRLAQLTRLDMDRLRERLKWKTAKDAAPAFGLTPAGAQHWERRVKEKIRAAMAIRAQLEPGS